MRRDVSYDDIKMVDRMARRIREKRISIAAELLPQYLERIEAATAELLEGKDRTHPLFNDYGERGLFAFETRNSPETTDYEAGSAYCHTYAVAHLDPDGKIRFYEIDPQQRHHKFNRAPLGEEVYELRSLEKLHIGLSTGPIPIRDFSPNHPVFKDHGISLKLLEEVVLAIEEGQPLPEEVRKVANRCWPRWVHP